MEGFCRGCLIKYDDPEELLEYTEKNRRLFIYATGLQVKRNDAFTFQLCKDCYVNMQQSCRFKKLCRTSDKKFRTYMSLKASGVTIDLCTYLKNNEDNFSLGWTGNSTPANQKKDDDNESVCTSIRNFMQDMLQETEMPDSEAGIIRQVIEEEADVLDDSLDSNWLRDDISIATDFRLDFSPFSTPRSEIGAHYHTPKRQADLTPEFNHFGDIKKLLESPNAHKYQREETVGKKAMDDILCDSLLDNSFGDNFDNNIKIKKNYDEKEIEKIENNLITEQVSSFSQIGQVNSKNYYVDNTLVEQPVTLVEQPAAFVEQPATFVEQPVTFVEQQATFVEQPVTFVEQPATFVEQPVVFDGKDMTGYANGCSDGLDRRLNEALENSENIIDLDDLLDSPKVYPTAAVPSTPTINNILFGEKLNDENSNQTQTGPKTNRIHNIQGSNEQYDLLVDVKIEPNTPSMSPFPHLENKKSNDLSEDINTNAVDNWIFNLRDSSESSELESDQSLDSVEVVDCTCYICDKTFKDVRGMKMHIFKIHGIKMPKAIRKRKPVMQKMICDYCAKEYFDKRNFVTHIRRHMGRQPIRCNRCGLTFSTTSKYKLHYVTHLGQRVMSPNREKATCDICRMTMLKSSLYKHLLRHARVFLKMCGECGHGFYSYADYRDHFREHTGERPHKCEVCGRSFIRKNALVRHMRIHTGERRFVCDNCHKGYANKITLINHIKCGRCSNFKKTGKLNRVPRKKTNEITVLTIEEDVAKPYECQFCHSRHKTLNYMLYHQRRSKACMELKAAASPANLVEIIEPGNSSNVLLEPITE